MYKKLLSIGAFFGLLSVVIGAFGAHGLEGKITEARITIFETGVDYQFYHTFAIFIAVGLAAYFKDDFFLKAGWMFVIGMLCFSGSLYFLATRTYLGIESWAKIIGPITPIGGLLLIAGWIRLAAGIWKIR